MQKRKATVAAIGAGDYIGGSTVFAGRRNGANLESLVKSIEAARAEIHARSLDARKEKMVVGLINDVPTVRELIDRIMTEAENLIRVRS